MAIIIGVAVATVAFLIAKRILAKREEQVPIQGGGGSSNDLPPPANY